MAVALDLALKATALLALASIGALLMGRASAASRHLLWLGLFCGVALLPLARAVLPPLPLAILAPSASALSVPRLAGQPLHLVVQPGPPGEMWIAAFHRPPTPPASARPSTPGRLILATWLIGLIACLARMVLGEVGVHGLRRRALAVSDPTLLGEVERARQALGVRRAITLLALDEDLMPVTWGLRRPTIVVPAVSRGWLADRPRRLSAVLAHEVAHIARFDAVAQFIAQLATSLLWFHPGFWMAQRQMRLERERACDDLALAQGIRPADYAMDLLMLVRSLRTRPGLALGILGMGGRSHLDRRIRDILNAGVNRRRQTWQGTLTAALILCTIAPLAAVRLTARSTRPVERRIFTNRLVLVPPRTPAGPLTHTPPGARSSGSRPAAVLGSAGAPVPGGAQSSTVGEPTLSAPTLVLFGHRARRPLGPATLGGATGGAQGAADADQRWHAARDQMLHQLIDMGQQLLENCKTQIRIGTMAVIDLAGPQRTIEALERLAGTPDASGAPAPTEDQLAAIRTRFAASLANLNREMTLFSVGLLGVTQCDNDLLAAAESIGPLTIAEAVVRTRSGAVSVSVPSAASESEFSAGLARAGRLASESERADALLAVAQHTVFTPAMVAQYVEAVVSLTSGAERARVLAQAIHVTSGGG